MENNDYIWLPSLCETGEKAPFQEGKDVDGNLVERWWLRPPTALTLALVGEYPQREE